MGIWCIINKTGFIINEHKICTYQFVFECVFLIHIVCHTVAKSVLLPVGSQCMLIVGFE